MTLDELRTRYNTAYRIIARERKMREHVFLNDPAARTQKVAEMDVLLGILTELKDFCKGAIAQEYEQPPLIDVPRKANYS